MYGNRTIIRIALLFALPWTVVLTAQVVPPTPTPEPAIEVDPSGEIKIFRDLYIAAGEVRTGNLRVIGGNVIIEGTTVGRLIVIGGDVDIRSTAVIEGDLIALGGVITKAEGAQIIGEVLEVNRGKMSLTKEQSKDLSALYDDESPRTMTLDYDPDVDSDAWKQLDDRRYGDRYRGGYYRDGRYGNRGRYYNSRSQIHQDFEIERDDVFRYNRAEGVAIYAPFTPDTYDIPGFQVIGQLGYAFGLGEWMGRLGIGEYLFDGRIGVLVEGHQQIMNNDKWRITPTENMVSSLLIHEDWYDWYRADGYGGSLIARLPFRHLGVRNNIQFQAKYVNEEHKAVGNNAEWSLFGGNKVFRDAFVITPEQDVNIEYSLKIGTPLFAFHRYFTLYGRAAQTETLEGSYFEYKRQEAELSVFIPFHIRLGIGLYGRAGNVISTGTNGYGPQHRTELGGIGSLQGYGYKSILGPTDNQYAFGSVSLAMRNVGSVLAITWQFGNTWTSDESLLQGTYMDDLKADMLQSVGFSIGDNDTRLEFYKPITEGYNNGWTMYFRINAFDWD